MQIPKNASSFVNGHPFTLTKPMSSPSGWNRSIYGTSYRLFQVMAWIDLFEFKNQIWQANAIIQQQQQQTQIRKNKKSRLGKRCEAKMNALPWVTHFTNIICVGSKGMRTNYTFLDDIASNGFYFGSRDFNFNILGAVIWNGMELPRQRVW